ncbi:MAG: hypothetical protein SVV03_06275 [Candidatus Nanohaloarchaea archaeon]|nr:hypothetical protein [Candidatus Nanohaloarchaea archaeon]
MKMQKEGEKGSEKTGNQRFNLNYFLSSRKAQSGVVTAVIIAGILVAGISSAYTWGLPILRKQQDTEKLKSTLGTFEKLSNEIQKVARRGGSSKIEFDVGDGILKVNISDNAVVYSTITSAAYVSTQEWVPLNENDLNGIEEVGLESRTGTLGRDKPGIIIGKADLQGDEYRTEYRLEYRQLHDPGAESTQLIELEKQGNLQVTGGQHQIIVEKGGEEIREVGAVSGRPLKVQKILIRIS